MSKEINSVNTKQEIEVDVEKRAFMKKFGKYAAVGAGMSVLMGPGVSTANAYGVTGNPGYGDAGRGGGHGQGCANSGNC